MCTVPAPAVLPQFHPSIVETPIKSNQQQVIACITTMLKYLVTQSLKHSSNPTHLTLPWQVNLPQRFQVYSKFPMSIAPVPASDLTGPGERQRH